MIKEFAYGVKKRHCFEDASNVDKLHGRAADTFVSLYDYDKDVIDYCKKKGSLSGFPGRIYMPDEFLLDIDGKSVERARDKTKGLLILLEDLDVPYKVYFSGTGFHVGIHSSSFRWKPDPNLHLKVKDALKNNGVFEYADPSVTDKLRIIRVVNTRNSKSGLYKVHIPSNWLDKDVKDILVYAKKPQKDKYIELECSPVFDARERTSNEVKQTILKQSMGRDPDPVNYTCIQRMMAGVDIGGRHMTALRLSAHLRWLYPESYVKMVMEMWRRKVNTDSSPFPQKEMDNIVKSAYEAHGGQGNRYGCSDPIMDKHCSSTCKLYKAKKSQNTMSANEMEEVLHEFFMSDVEPINIGKLYNQDFPIYPGEVVIIQAPPKSMKTMLLQNWVNALKRPTYFMEMEMSPRQMMMRFIQMEMGWNEKQIREHYKSSKNGVAQKLDWLTVDFSAPYAYELEKRIMMLPIKPEIVVVDHMGLFKSNHRDNNMKVEEASQALMELAVKNNLIVFAVSEITKQAFHEGMNIASSKGSFRTAYNTNKLLSVVPYKSKSTGLIEMLEVRCEANRERENLHVKLEVNDTKIGVNYAKNDIKNSIQEHQ